MASNSRRPQLAAHTVEWRRERADALSATQRKRADARTCSAPLELRDANDDGVRILRSYASLFNTPYTIGGGGYRFDEVVRPGAFKRSLGSRPDVVFRTEHSGPPLAATWNDTLRLGEDEIGFWYEADLNPRDQDAQSLIAKVERRDYRESSFAFRVPNGGDEWNDDRSQRALIHCEIDRGDVSVVTFGASAATGKHMVLRSAESLAALQAIGFEAFLEAWTEWRDFTLLTVEERAGRVISSSSMETLRRVLDLVSNADDAVDEAQPLLADLMGVPNPDADDEDEDEDEDERSRRTQRWERRNSGGAADLKDAIRAVGRGGSDHDTTREHVIERATALGHGDLIPDNWNSDGSLSDSKAMWSTAEQRETFSDLMVAAAQALADGDDDGWCGCWVQDMDESNVYYQDYKNSCIMACPYTLQPGGALILGEPERVRPSTSYVPIDRADRLRAGRTVTLADNDTDELLFDLERNEMRLGR